MRPTDILAARFKGAKAAMTGIGVTENPYGETDLLHFEWLAAWASVKMDKLKASKDTEKPKQPTRL